MKRLSLLIPALACLAACTPSAESPHDLGALVVDYLEDGDFDGFYENLVATESEVSKLCPTLLDEYDLDASAFRPGFDRCTKWAFEPGDMFSRPGTAECGVEHLSLIEYGTGAPTGGKWSIHGAIATEDGWKVLGALDCPGR